MHPDAPNASRENFSRDYFNAFIWAAWLPELEKLARATGNGPVKLVHLDHPEWGAIGGYVPAGGRRTTW